MKHKALFKIVFHLTVIISMSGCFYDKEQLLYPGSNVTVDCSTVSAKFNTDILPLITSKCAVAGCHNTSASGGIILQKYSQVANLAERINARVVMEKTMPPTGALLPSEIGMLKCWIDAGTPNN